MGRRQAPHPSRSRPDSPETTTTPANDEWTRWRPRPKRILLGLCWILLIAWAGFLLAMIALK